MKKLKKIEFLGVEIVSCKKKELEEFFLGKLTAKKDFTQIVTINNEMFLYSLKNKKFRELIQQKTLNICDSFGLKVLAKIFQGKTIIRWAGVDLAKYWCKLAEHTGSKVFLLGGQNGVGKISQENLLAKFPRLKIVGQEEEPDLAKIKKAGTEILLVCFGSPKQEFWIDENASKIPSLILAGGFGGTFDFWSGRVKRAPILMQKIGMEWFWRLVREPARFKRIFSAVIIFPFYTLKIFSREKISLLFKK